MSKTLKSVSVYRYDILENGLADEIENWDAFIQSKTEYAEEGHLIREITYGSWGDEEQLIEYVYDEQTQLIEEKYYQGDEELTESKVYERDPSGRILKEYHRFFDGSEDVLEYQYDENSILKEKVMTDSDGDAERKEVFEYSGDKLVKEMVMDGQGSIISEASYSYNEEGKLEQTDQYSIEDGRSERIVTVFDAAGNRKKELKYNTQEQLVEINRFIYSEDGKLLEIEEENQRGKSYLAFTYDEKGEHVTGQEELNDKGEVISSIEREFDEEGRLLTATVFIDGMNYRPNQNYLIRYTYEFYD
jgi:hypothetical protein